MHPSLDLLDDQGFDFNPFDQNNKGMMDSIVLLHTDYAAKLGGEDCNKGRGHDRKAKMVPHCCPLRIQLGFKTQGIQARTYSVG